AAPGLREDLGALLDLLDAVATPGPVDEAELANAKARARARGAGRRRSARADAEDRLLARAFGGPFAPPEDPEAAWEALDLETVRAFAGDVVCGPNLAVSLVGGFDPDVVRRRVESFDGRLADGPRWRPAVEAPSWAGFDAPTVFEPTARNQVSVVVAFPGVGVQAQDERAALDLVDAWWSGRRIPSGPLYDALRGERDLAYAVEATHLPMPGAGLFFVHVRCAPDRYAETVGAIDGALATLAEAKLGPDDLRAARNVLLASRQSVVQTAAARARLHALAEVYDLTGDGGDAYRSCVAATDLDAVRAAIRARFAAPGRRLVLWPEGVSRP
ncbi:MAG: M16 family metallopeptidase, partial [Planctomycetota bacterium JB042]